MTNPIFSKSDAFGEPRRTGVRGAQGGVATTSNPNGHYGAAGHAAMDAVQLDAMYAAPAATTADTQRLTYDDVIIKTGGLLALLVAVGAAAWTLVPEQYLPIVWIVGLLGGLVLGLVNAFKKNPSPALIVAYTVFEGAFLGAISKFFEMSNPGIVIQATLATACTFAVCLLLFKSGKVRVTPKFTRWLMIAIAGYAVFSLVNFGLVMFNVLDGWGMRNGWFGIAIGLVAVGLAAASLIVDFDSIKRGVDAGVPAKMAWAAAFGLLVTLIWLYLEFLRLIAIFNSD